MELREIGRTVTKRFALVADSDLEETIKVIRKSKDEIVLETTSIEKIESGESA